MARYMTSTVLLAAAFVSVGCAQPPAPAMPAPAGELLFDARTGCTGRSHFTLVADPFGGREKTGRGDAGAKGRQKMVFLDDDGFFAMPADPGDRAVVVRLAVKGARDLRVMLVAGEEHGTYLRRLQAEGKWVDLRLPLSEARAISAGAKVVDITIWQMDTGKGNALYVQKAWLGGRK